MKVAESRGTADSPMYDRLLHLHIPKTGGTSLRSVLTKAYGPKQTLHYDTFTGQVMPVGGKLLANENPGIDTLKAFIHRHGLFKIALPLYRTIKSTEQSHSIAPQSLADTPFKVLSGHFTGGDISRWDLEGIPVVSVVRNPLERAQSQYRHWSRTKGVLAFGSSTDIPYDPDITFEYYLASSPSLANYQTKMIGDVALTRVGAFEKLPGFVEALGLGITDTLPHLNRSEKQEPTHIGKTAMAQFYEDNAADYELYERALSERHVSN